MTTIVDHHVLDAASETALADELRAAIRGEVITRQDPGYDRARRVWNGLIDHHPAGIARCTGTADVVETVRIARRHRPIVSVRGGGHQVAIHRGIRSHHGQELRRLPGG